MFQKPKYKKQKRAKNNPVPTINDLCRYTQTPYAQLHEVFFGTGERQLSIKYKMQVRLSNDLHRELHANPLRGLDIELKKEFQEKFESEYGHEKFMKTFMADYIRGY